MKSLLENKKVKITLMAVLVLIVLLLVIGLVMNNVNNINKEQNPKLQARERIEQVLEMAKVAKENNENYNSNEYLDNLFKSNSIMINGNVVSTNGYNFEIDRENLGITNEIGNTNVDISSEVTESTGTDANGRELGKVALNFTSNIPIYKIQIENVDGTLVEEKVNNTTYEKEIDVVFGHTHTVSVITSDGKISMHKIMEQKPLPITNPTEGSEIRTGNPLPFTWAEIAEIAKIISDESSITRNTQEFTLRYKGNTYTIGVGDYTTLNDKQVRIMGFNHDELVSADAYGEGKDNTYAGISFEFAECISIEILNSSYQFISWDICELRKSLNNTTINLLGNKQYIKQVKKQHISKWKNADSLTTSQDKLWLLSCSEIWNNGYQAGAYGYAIAEEGGQYKYYKNINAIFSSANSNLQKKHEGFEAKWWLRSIDAKSVYPYSFSAVDKNGAIYTTYTTVLVGVAPGFCI